MYQASHLFVQVIVVNQSSVTNHTSEDPGTDPRAGSKAESAQIACKPEGAEIACQPEGAKWFAGPGRGAGQLL